MSLYHFMYICIDLGIFMETFRQAMNKWELATCLKFKPAQENHTAYLNFTDKEGYEFLHAAHIAQIEPD